MSYTPPKVIDLSTIENLLIENSECCKMNSNYLININKRLNNYDNIFKELLRCCFKPIMNNKPIIPGQIVYPAPIEKISKEIKSPIKNNQKYDILYSEPSIININRKEYDTPFYPHADVIGLHINYKIINNSYIGPDNVDLKKWLPLELNYKNNNVILEKILDYRILIGGGLYPRPEVVLVYQTYDNSTGVRKTFEASVFHYRKWWDIHIGIKNEDNNIKSGRNYQKGVID